jgi:hypothetical protein
MCHILIFTARTIYKIGMRKPIRVINQINLHKYELRQIIQETIKTSLKFCIPEPTSDLR